MRRSLVGESNIATVVCCIAVKRENVANISADVSSGDEILRRNRRSEKAQPISLELPPAVGQKRLPALS